MKYLKVIVLAVVAACTFGSAQAQVRVGVGVGIGDRDHRRVVVQHRRYHRPYHRPYHREVVVVHHRD